MIKKNCQNNTLLNEAYINTKSKNLFTKPFQLNILSPVCYLFMQFQFTMNEDCCKFSSTIKLKNEEKLFMEKFENIQRNKEYRKKKIKMSMLVHGKK